MSATAPAPNRFQGFIASEQVPGAAVIERGYRYLLTRRWSGLGPDQRAPMRVCWIMLNPSTADALHDDATIRRCVGFSKLWGYGALIVANLFAHRSMDPRQLVTVADPVGPHNDEAITYAVGHSALVLLAWGAHGELYGRGRDVRALVERLGRPTKCLALTGGGQPVHPLRQPKRSFPRDLPPVT